MSTSETRKVVLHNDANTPFPFVIETLGTALELPGSKLVRIALATHLQGAAEIGEYSAHEANVRSTLICLLAEIRGWPLCATVESADWAPGEEESKAAGERDDWVRSLEYLADEAERFENGWGSKSTIRFGERLSQPGPRQVRIGVCSWTMGEITITIDTDTQSTES